jgi:hypothetical protein
VGRDGASVRNSSMKILISLLALWTFLFAVLRFPSCKQTDEAREHQSAEPFHTPKVGEKLQRACADCHSNQTNWPWYSHIAPLSWWIQNHVRQGQREFNFSDWETYSSAQRRRELESICGLTSMGRMPPASYTLMHPQAKLSVQDKKAICSWANSELEREK